MAGEAPNLNPRLLSVDAVAHRLARRPHHVRRLVGTSVAFVARPAPYPGRGSTASTEEVESVGRFHHDLPSHEGYADRRLPDGTVTSTWTAATADFRAYVTTCECGWRGGDHEPTEEGYEEALDEWDVEHPEPLLAEAVPGDVTRIIGEVKQAVSELIADRPLAGLKVLEGLARWAEASAGGAREGAPAAGIQARFDGTGFRRRGPRLG